MIQTFIHKGGKKNKPLVGVVVAIGPNQVGWSLCKKGDRFDKQFAVEVAQDRALKGSKAPLPHSVYNEYYAMVNRAEKYFKKNYAVKFDPTNGIYDPDCRICQAMQISDGISK